MQEELREIVAIVHEGMRANLTDAVFSLIQSNKSLMDRYLHVVANTGDLRVVNSHLAMAVRDEFATIVAHENGCRVENKDPNSTIIKSNSVFQRG